MQVSCSRATPESWKETDEESQSSRDLNWAFPFEVRQAPTFPQPLTRTATNHSFTRSDDAALE